MARGARHPASSKALPGASLSAALLVSNVLPVEVLSGVQAAALGAWPFLRVLGDEEARRFLLLAPPHTSDSGMDRVALERAFTQNEALYDALPSWSASFPEARFALVEVEEVGGRCRYGGYVCQAGEVHDVVLASAAGDILLLGALGIELGRPLGLVVREWLGSSTIDP